MSLIKQRPAQAPATRPATIIQPANFSDKYPQEGIFAVNGCIFFSRTPESPNDATSINQAMRKIINQ